MFLVPIFDASKSFQGGEPALNIDFSKVSTQYKLYEHELCDGDLVAVAHSVFFNYYREKWNVRYGIYFVVLLAKLKDAGKK